MAKSKNEITAPKNLEQRLFAPIKVDLSQVKILHHIEGGVCHYRCRLSGAAGSFPVNGNQDLLEFVKAETKKTKKWLEEKQKQELKRRQVQRERVANSLKDESND